MKQNYNHPTELLCQQYLNATLDADGERLLLSRLLLLPSLSEEQKAILALLQIDFPDDGDVILAQADSMIAICTKDEQELNSEKETYGEIKSAPSWHALSTRMMLRLTAVAAVAVLLAAIINIPAQQDDTFTQIMPITSHSSPKPHPAPSQSLPTARMQRKISSTHPIVKEKPHSPHHPEADINHQLAAQERLVAQKEKQARLVLTQSYEASQRLIQANEEDLAVSNAERETDFYVSDMERFTRQRINDMEEYLAQNYELLMNTTDKP